MLWVETGAAHFEWASNPMQIGILGDPGLYALLSGNEGGELILPVSLKKRIKASSVKINPADNIRAGIGYLLMRLARFEYKSIPDIDDQLHEVVINPGDSLARIAKVNGTTSEILRKLNPQALILQLGQILKYRKGAVRRVVVGWRMMDTNEVARLYNGGGDPKYAQKLNFAFGLVKQGREVVCE